MKMTAPVMANEFVSHGKKEKSKARPSKQRESRPPGRAKAPESAEASASWMTYSSGIIQR
jgi:hypothetical protein